jgi:hypothetical protein
VLHRPPVLVFSSFKTNRTILNTFRFLNAVAFIIKIDLVCLSAGACWAVKDKLSVSNSKYLFKYHFISFFQLMSHYCSIVSQWFYLSFLFGSCVFIPLFFSSSIWPIIKFLSWLTYSFSLVFFSIIVRYLQLLFSRLSIYW